MRFARFKNGEQSGISRPDRVLANISRRRQDVDHLRAIAGGIEPGPYADTVRTIMT